MRHLYTVTFNDSIYQTSINPLGIGVFFKPGNDIDTTFGAGYLFGGYERQVAIAGSRNELVFWDLCEPCTKYKQRQCSGGYKVLSSSPGYDSMRFTNSRNASQRVYYNKEFCTVHYDTPALTRALTSPSRVPVHLLPHFVVLKGSGSCYWYLYRPNSNGSDLEFLPYRIFNTYPSGEMCFGSTSIAERRSIPSRYESFLNARMNRDLNPTRNSGSRDFISTADWARLFTPEALIDYTAMQWKTSQGRFGARCVFLVLPPNYQKIKFLVLRDVEIPEVVRSSMESGILRSTNTMPFIQDSQGSWFSTYNTSLALNSSNCDSALTRQLRL